MTTPHKTGFLSVQSFWRVSGVTFARQLIGTLGPLAAVWSLARFAGANKQGTYSLLVALLWTSVLVATFGSPQILARSAGQGPRGLIQARLQAWALTLGPGLVLGCGCWASSVYLRVGRAGELAMLVAVPAAVMSTLIGHVLLGVHCFAAYNQAQLMPALAMLIGAFLTTHYASLTPALLCMCWGQVMAALWCLRALTHHLAHHQQQHFTVSWDLGQLLKSCAPNALGRISDQLTLRLGLLSLGMAHPGPMLGLFAVAESTCERLTLASEALGATLLADTIGRNSAYDGLKPVGHTVRAFATTFIVMGIGGSLAAVVAPSLLTNLFGPHYAACSVLVRWLVPGVIAQGLSHILVQDLAGRGLLAAEGRLAALGAVTAALLCAILVPSYGARGAAQATSTALIVSFILRLRLWTHLIKPWRRQPRQASTLQH